MNILHEEEPKREKSSLGCIVRKGSTRKEFLSQPEGWVRVTQVRRGVKLRNFLGEGLTSSRQVFGENKNAVDGACKLEGMKAASMMGYSMQIESVDR